MVRLSFYEFGASWSRDAKFFTPHSKSLAVLRAKYASDPISRLAIQECSTFAQGLSTKKARQQSFMKKEYCIPFAMHASNEAKILHSRQRSRDLDLHRGRRARNIKEPGNIWAEYVHLKLNQPMSEKK